MARSIDPPSTPQDRTDNPIATRISFQEAIEEKLLLKQRFSELSFSQQTALKIFYGLPLDEPGLALWSAFQGHGQYDELGYLTGAEPLAYLPKEYQQACLICGRRWGKTDSFSSTILAYEATCGGHEDYIRKGAQKGVCFLVAQDLRLARENLPLIQATLEASPLLRKEIANRTADFLELRNGISIGVAPPTSKAIRGYAVPVIGMDEVGMWYSDSESANPDYEVERAVRFAQMQFPHRKRLITSTPWTKEGLLWKYHNAGTEGRKIVSPEKRKAFRDALVLYAPTATAGHKFIRKEDLQREFDNDPLAFERESLAKFVDSISGFLNSALIHEAIDEGVFQRAPQEKATYLAAIDPAFRRDAFGFTIVHHDEARGIVQDFVYRWKAGPGEVLNPAEILDQIVPILRQYRIFVVYSDQYHLDSLQQLALDRGFAIEGVTFTGRSKAAIYGSLQAQLNTKRLHLLDSDAGHTAAAETVAELVILEKRLTQQGGIQISAPAGRHDDMATVLALACYKAVWMTPIKLQNQPTHKEPSIHERCLQQIHSRRFQRDNADGVWD